MLLVKSHGTVFNKNILFFKNAIVLQFILSDGLQVVTQLLRDLTTALLGVMLLLVALLLMLITKPVFMLELKFLEQMLRSCQVTGNSESDIVQVSNLKTTSGSLASFFIVSLKSSNSLLVLNQSYYMIGMAQNVTQTFLLRQ